MAGGGDRSFVKYGCTGIFYRIYEKNSKKQGTILTFKGGSDIIT